MPIPTGQRRAVFRRAFAIVSVVLATGGLVLFKTPAEAGHGGFVIDGKNAATWRGPGAHGSLALSHTRVLSGSTTPLYAELRFAADAGERALRAPISLAVVLDTSGSMEGAKIEDAKRSVLRLLDDMRDEDEIAVVRYSDTSELLQPLARVRDVRRQLQARIRALGAGGGTNIPSGLAHGLRTLESSRPSGEARVRRIVLVSDGLDSTRAQAEALARSSFTDGITVSSIGIGLDFDESYMGAVAQSGHGNFAFLNDGASLATFLKRELHETASTTIDDARVAIRLPRGVRFVSITGAEASVEDGELQVRLGSVFAGDERRVLLELASDGSVDGELRATATWRHLGSSPTNVDAAPLRLATTTSADEVERGRDASVYASAMSVLASKRQLEAASAWAQGDVARATSLTEQNQRDLAAAIAAAPTAAPALSAQAHAYEKQKDSFRLVAPASPEAKSVRKAGAVRDLDNLNRASSF
jgi:Ca-activated chloride channel homolog